ncbi:MAG: hypothetical protein CME32_18410 [Gimesia sp.]|nr:hypothetical protein [Gimesia sp.]
MPAGNAITGPELIVIERVGTNAIRAERSEQEVADLARKLELNCQPIWIRQHQVRRFTIHRALCYLRLPAAIPDFIRDHAITLSMNRGRGSPVWLPAERVCLCFVLRMVEKAAFVSICQTNLARRADTQVPPLRLIS